jgi:hypothetical protein
VNKRLAYRKLGHRDRTSACPLPAASARAHYHHSLLRERQPDPINRSSSGHETLRALFLIDSEQEETVLEIAGQLPAVRAGATVEVWPLIETAANHDDQPRTEGI